jgi:hypothetical protein
MSSRKKKKGPGGAHGNQSRSRSGEEVNRAAEESHSGSNRQAILRTSLFVCLLVGVIVLGITRPWSSAPEPTPAAWEYDEANDRHWDPTHGHWHDGPPPERNRPASSWTGIPVPWEYDPANDRYWDPNHGHWHSGRPPPPEQR